MSGDLLTAEQLLSLITNGGAMPPGYVNASPANTPGAAGYRLLDAAHISTGIMDPNRLGTGSTGAGNLYLADDGTWKAVGGGGGGGDMYKATYDVDNDGVVDSAERTEIIVRNSTGTTLTKGTVVYLSGATGNRPNALRAQAHTEATSSKTIGIVEADISNNSDGYVATNGTLHDLDTSAFAAGVAVWLSATTAGGITSTVPAEPNHAVFIGWIARSHPTAGRIVLHIQNGYELDEIHGVLLTSEANNDLLVYESSTDLWKNKSISTIFGGTPLVSVPTLAQVTTAGNTTTNAITVGAITGNIGSISQFKFNSGAGSATPTIAVGNLDTGGKFAALLAGTVGAEFNFDNSGWFAIAGDSKSNYNSNNLGSGSETYYLRIQGSTGNVQINTTTDAGYRLDVNGTARILNSFTVGNAIFSISGNTLTLTTNASSSKFQVSTTNNRHFELTGGTTTNGTVPVQAFLITSAFQNSSGTATYIVINNNPTINTSGTHSGAFRGYYYNPTLTSLVGVTDHISYQSTSGRMIVSGAVVTQSGLGQGAFFNNTLVAAANNDVLVGLDINPTFTNGAFTGVTNLGLRSYSGFNLYSSGNGHFLTATSTTSTDGTLHFRRSAGNNGPVKLQLGGSVVLNSNDSTGEIQMSYGSGYFLTVFAHGTEAMRIPLSRNVLIGTTTDSGYKLDVNGTARVQGALTATLANVSTSNVVYYNSSTGLMTYATAPIGAQFVIDYDYNIVGLKNGVNVLFTTSATFIVTTTRVFLNGQRLTRGAGYDYIETGTNQITFTNPPVSTDLIIIEYQI